MKFWRRKRREARTATLPLHTQMEVEILSRFFDHFCVDCVLDVGANRGQYATMLREHVGFRGAIVSFEPVPAIARALKKAAEFDPLWLVEEVALSDAPGSSVLNVMSFDQFSSLQRPTLTQPKAVSHMNKVSTQVAVRCSTIDTEIQNLRKRLNFSRPFLKMDTQGHDTKVFAGASESIQSLVGLQSEISFVPIYDGGVTAESALALYRQAGFILTALVPNNRGHFPNLLEMDCIMYREPARA